MKNLFDYENGFMRAISRIADSFALSILWVICSIPVFTVGASSAAFYFAYNKCIRQKEDYVWRTFFSGFRSNFKQATQLWLIELFLWAFTAFDCYLVSFMASDSPLVAVVQTVLVTLAAYILIWGLYLFPYLSRFESPTKTVMKNCALIALANLPWSILLLAAFAVAAFGFACLPMLNVLIPALYMFCANIILEKVFRKYISPEDLTAQTVPDTECDKTSG